MKGTIRQRAVRHLLFGFGCKKIVKKYEGEDNLAFQMFKATIALAIKISLVEYVRLLKLETAIRHPNWDDERVKNFILNFAKDTIKEYDEKQKVES